ncbi:hypothetical protein TNCV_3074321 [Trichonephila clavipes]|uniref:Uncharacterized protein n=1 Tax=Trichonephila clavipes TaxID=2585209 RepID=A0A8X6SFG5_TRICX|nr:hypothetical protein TNCV_3074321 [Trichonephila clavipes]
MNSSQGNLLERTQEESCIEMKLISFECIPTVPTQRIESDFFQTSSLSDLMHCFQSACDRRKASVEASQQENSK